MRFYASLFLLFLGLALNLIARADPEASAPAASPEAAGEAPADGEAPAADEAPAPAPLPQLGQDGGAAQRVVVIPIHGTIDLGLAPYVRRVLDANQGAAAVILDVDTFGGRVDAAVQIRDALLASPVPIVAFVNRRAISAGALISLGANTIVFAPGGSMGAATPIQMEGGEAKPVEEKMVSYMRGEMRATAEARGRRSDLAEAMVDADVEIEGVIAAGKLLTLTTEEAVKVGLAAGEAEDLPALLDGLGLSKAELSRPESTWAETLARFLTDPTFSGILMSLGMLGLLIELYTPGFGWTGAVGLLCLGLFFFGHMVASLAGWEEVLIFAVGVVCIGLEIFVFPGFGLSGVLGISLLVISLAMAMVGLPLQTSWGLGLVRDALTLVLWSTVGAVALMILAIQVLPSRGLARWLVLSTTLGHAERAAPGEQDWQSAPSEWSKLVGKRGVATTDLRLAGKARIEDRIYDVVSQQDYLTRGTPIRVLQVEGVRVVVDRDPDSIEAEQSNA